jgi:hypothetical protein
VEGEVTPEDDASGAVAFLCLVLWVGGLILIGGAFGSGWLGVALVASIALDNFTITIKRK